MHDNLRNEGGELKWLVNLAIKIWTKRSLGKLETFLAYSHYFF